MSNSVFSNRSTVAATKYKLIVIGESMIGKTSLIQRYVTSNFQDHGTQPTMGCDFKVKTIQLGGERKDGSYMTGDLL